MTAIHPRSKARTLAVVAILAVVGCEPRHVASVHGLIDGALKPEPFAKAKPKAR